jgi:hypothetical protein
VRREFWERHWINEVFSFGHDLRIREVLVLNTWDPYEDLLRSVTDHGRLILLIIDERDHFPRALMRQFGAVIRVGFDYGDYPPNTLTIPLYLPEPTFREAGCRTLSSDFDSRPYLWSFAGDGHKNRERREMLSAFSPIRPGHKHIFRGWLPPIALQPRDYAALIRDSIFVPVRQAPFMSSATVPTRRLIWGPFRLSRQIITPNILQRRSPRRQIGMTRLSKCSSCSRITPA